MHYAVHESCPHTDTFGFFFFFSLSVREELLILCQREETDRDGTSNGDSITHGASRGTSDFVIQFKKNLCFTEDQNMWK